ncbi:MAG: STAS domain-containing protein [Lachnospiraceae bacterium]|nr:STAS domain-containing protein [Lachnospiraceae bacterium]
MELEIKTWENEGVSTLELNGRLTTNSAPYLERMVGSAITKQSDIVLDCAQLQYVSSAGLRVFKKIYLWTNAHNKSFVLKNVNDMVMEVLNMVGLSKALTIE